MKTTKPLVWAHRGASGYAPENTLEAFQKAVDMKADGIELDVQMTADGELVVCHDEEIDRTSNGSGRIRDFSLEELKSFDFSNGEKGYEGTVIPTLREVFELLKGTNLIINIELKTGMIFYLGMEEKVLALTEEYGMMERVIFSSFNHYTICRIKELCPKAKCGFLYSDGILKMPEYGKKYGVEALHPAGYNLQFPGFMEECKKYHLEVNVWTVNTKEDIKKCCEMGVHAIITNYPDVAKTICKEWME